MSRLTDRIFNNWKSTLIGFLIIGGALGAVYFTDTTLTEAGAFILTGITLFFLNDPKNPSAGAVVNGVALLVFLFLLFTALS